MKNFIERLKKIKRTERTDQSERGLGYDIGFNMAINNAIDIYNELHPSTEIIAPEPEKQAKEGSFKVRVTDNDGLRWYEVGKEYEVTDVTEDHYMFDEYRYIKKSDCEIIPETTKTNNMKKAINLRTLEEFQEFTKVFNPRKLPNPSWKNENFCMNLITGEWASLNFYEQSNYQVITYQEWLKENQPETTVIKFDYDRWKSGDYLQVVDGLGNEITKLTEFEIKDNAYCMYGVRQSSVTTWTKAGHWNQNENSDLDLHLEIATPKPKQVTTYHYLLIDGCIMSTLSNQLKRYIGETITEQQPDGSFKIISTTLK